jgi:hypothetical protein
VNHRHTTYGDQHPNVAPTGTDNNPMENSAMTTDVRFNEAELTQLHLLLARDVESSRVELHHTAGFPYRDALKERMERGRELLKKMEQALPALQLADAG